MSKPNDYDFYCEYALLPNADIKKVFEYERILAYYHTKLYWEEHIVVIPKVHILDLRAVEDLNLFTELITAARDILRSLPQAKLDEKGAKLLTNLGKFQDTPHLHFHIAIADKIR